ncbi:MAG TPA: HAMP domain-containing sensor histidine kinase [Thermomicrobiaceae bacterium]|nr:HAMP domain-containing sensor histidine kinase [Thermomicrobiaceae bacterium]
MTEALRGTWARTGIATRLLLLQALILITAMGVVLVILDQSFVHGMVQSQDHTLTEEVAEYASAGASRPAGQDLPAFSTEYLQTHQFSLGTGLIIGLPNGQVVRGTGMRLLQQTPQVQDWLAHRPASTVLTDVPVGGTTYRVLVDAVTVDGGGTATLVVGADLGGVQEAATDALVVISIEAGIATILALGGTYLLLRRVLGIVGRVTTTAQTISLESLGHRVGYRGPADEVGRLAHTFDDMLGRIDAASRAQRQLLANVSHQLRTPLTVMRGHLEVLQRGGYDDRAEVDETVTLVLDEIQHTARMVDQLLMLGRALEPDFIEVDRVDLRAFLADIFEAARQLAPRDWSLGTVPNVVVRVDPVKLRAAIFNLIDNAVKATRPGDFIALEAHHDRELVLAVADGGRGVPLDRQATLFERFARAGDGDDRGAGLGLALVKAVAEAHGGYATLESAPGSGCVVRIALPATCVEDAAGAPALATV